MLHPVYDEPDYVHGLLHTLRIDPAEHAAQQITIACATLITAANFATTPAEVAAILVLLQDCERQVAAAYNCGSYRQHIMQGGI